MKWRIGSEADLLLRGAAVVGLAPIERAADDYEWWWGSSGGASFVAHQKTESQLGIVFSVKGKGVRYSFFPRGYRADLNQWRVAMQ